MINFRKQLVYILILNEESVPINAQRVLSTKVSTNVKSTSTRLLFTFCKRHYIRERYSVHTLVLKSMHFQYFAACISGINAHEGSKT